MRRLLWARLGIGAAGREGGLEDEFGAGAEDLLMDQMEWQ